MKKFILSLWILSSVFNYSQNFYTSKAQGTFLAFGVGPRMPVFDFFKNTDIGYGLNVEFSYTDTDFIPVFFYGSIGVNQFPGSQSFYQESDYSNFHTNAVELNAGVRNYFSPLVENIVLFMPFVQGGISYTYFQKLHEFKVDRGKKNFLEKNSKLGFNIGMGFSMFMMEILGTYHIFKSNNFISVDLKIRIPIYVSF
jgi:opacity protein-like surface antigen